MPQDARHPVPTSDTRSAPAQATRSFAMVMMVLAICLVVTGVTCRLVLTFEERRTQTRFDHVAEQTRVEFEEQIRTYVDSLRGPQGLYAASISVERDEWRAYVKSLRLPTNYPAMKSMGYIAYVKNAGLSTFLEHARHDGAPDFTLKPDNKRDDYCIVTYAEPEKSVLGPLGIDWGIDPEVRATLDRARDTDTPIISPPLQPLLPGLPVPGTVVIVPVYTNGQPHDNEEQRRAAIQGWVVAPLDLHPLVDGLPNQLLSNVAMRIYDGTNVSVAAMLYNHDDDPETGAYKSPAVTVSVAGRAWTLTFDSNPWFDEGNSDSMSLFVLAAGIIVSVLITGITWSITQTESRAVALANEREDALRESESHLEAALNATDDGLWDWDLRTNKVFFSDRWFAMLGYGPRDLPSTFEMWKSLVHPEQLPTSLKKLNDHIEGRSPAYQAETQLRHRDGRWMWIQSRGKVVDFDRDGKPIRMAGKCTDVTLRKTAEDDLHASEQRQRLFVEHAPAAVAMLDREARYLMISKRWEHDLDATAEELIGHSHYDVFPNTAPMWREVLARALNGEVQRYDEQPFERRNGVVRWFRSEIRPWYLPSGEVGGVLVFTEDITARKEAAAAVARAAELNRSVLSAASEVAIIATDINGIITVFNTGAERMLGYHAQEMVDRQTAAAIVVNSEIDERNEQMSKRLSRPVSGFELFVTMTQSGKPEEREWTFVRKGGTKLTVNLVVTARLDDEGKTVGYVGVASDITARKRAEQELLQAKIAAESANRAKSAFLANMSHEIRTPMNGIIGMSDLILSTSLNRQQLEFAQTIRKCGHSLLTVLNDILDFSKIEAGKMVLESVPFALRETVESVLDIFAEAAGAKKIELAVLIYADVPDHLRGDPSRLRQVLMNLIGNAVKFTETGEIVLRVFCTESADENTTLSFSVSDTGIGISAEAQERLFRPFTQADNSMTRRYGGTGLGLAISKQLVEMMGGTIGINSEPGHGATFTFTARFARQPHPVSPADDSQTALAGKCALIVDDNETNRRILQYQLGNWHMRELSVGSGAQAMVVLEQQLQQNTPIDIVLLDLQMPEMDSMTVASRITADPRFRQTRIIILTSAGWPLAAEETEAMGVRAWLNKPVKQAVLYDCIRSVLQGAKPRFLLDASAGALEKIDRADAEEFELRDELAELENIPLPLASRGRVLVVEDNEVNQRVIELQLRKLGFASLIVGHGMAALDALENTRFDMVIMDCQMPEMDGYETTREVRRREQATGRHIPVIAMTAHAMDGDREKCLNAGMDDYLSKPVRLNVLADAISRWMAPRNQTGATAPTAENGNASAAAVTAAEKALFDVNHLRELCGGDVATMRDLIALYVRETRGRLAQLATAREPADLIVMQRIAHTAKGSSGMMGAGGLVGPFREIEVAARDGNVAEVARLTKVVAGKFDDACRHLTAEGLLAKEG